MPLCFKGLISLLVRLLFKGLVVATFKKVLLLECP